MDADDILLVVRKTLLGYQLEAVQRTTVGELLQALQVAQQQVLRIPVEPQGEEGGN